MLMISVNKMLLWAVAKFLIQGRGVNTHLASAVNVQSYLDACTNIEAVVFM